MKETDKERVADIQSEVIGAYQTFINNLEGAIVSLENDINEAAEMTKICTGEWCEATEHVVDELHNALYSISEPHGTPDEDSKKLRRLKKRVHDIYATYKFIKK